jgi:hypothetical protein
MAVTREHRFKVGPRERLQDVLRLASSTGDTVTEAHAELALNGPANGRAEAVAALQKAGKL